MKISVTSLIPILTFLIQKTESRNQGCSLLILVDDSMMSLVQNDETRLKQKLDKYINELNDIYQTTILKDPPNNNLYFFIKHVTHLKNFIPACKNKQIILDSVTKVGRGSDYCLVHFLMSRDIECIEGLGNLNGVCKRHSNTAWTNVHIQDDEKTVNTIAHEIGHNFGSEHDGQNSSAYSGCNSPETKGIMGGLMTRTFSTCSLSAMHHRLQQVYRDEEEEARCLTLAPEDTGVTSSYEMDSRDLSSFSTPCPLEPDSDCDPELPDPPEAPEPPEPECGDKEVTAVHVYSVYNRLCSRCRSQARSVTAAPAGRSARTRAATPPPSPRRTWPPTARPCLALGDDNDDDDDDDDNNDVLQAHSASVHCLASGDIFEMGITRSIPRHAPSHHPG